MNETITITGNVATDPEHKHAGGVSITTFRVASRQRRSTGRPGAWIDTGDELVHRLDIPRPRRSRLRVAAQGRPRGADRATEVRDWEAGEQKGTSVEIDADAIGHDLLWGTSRVREGRRRPRRRRSRRRRVGTRQAELPRRHGVDDAADGWRRRDGRSRTVPEDRDAEPRPLELAGVETPF